MSERPKLKELAEELHDVKRKWKVIGTQLEIPRPTLENIEVRYKDDLEEAFTEMMNEWLKQADEPSWRAIAEVLRSRSVGETKLAKNVELNKCSERDDTDDSYTDPLMAVATRQEGFTELPHSTEVQMLPYHRVEEVPPNVREGIRYLAKSLNILRIKTYRHVIGLQRVTPDEFRVIVCNPERYWEGDDHKRVCLAKSVPAIFAIVSHRRYLNWQNFDLLEEIIEAYGDSNLKGELKGFCEEIEVFENETSLEDVKNIIFTPLGPNGYLMKVPLDGKPTLATARAIKNGLKKKNGYPVHHVGQNSPLAIFFIVPRLFIPPISMAKLKATPESIEDRVIYTLSEQEVLQLLDLTRLPTPGDKEAPSGTLDSGSIQPANKLQVFKDDILHKSFTTIVCKGEFNHLPCAAKYMHQELAQENVWKDKFRKGCDFLRSCHHPNIVMFLGLDLHHPLAPVLLTELMDGSLEQFLNRSEAAVPLHTQIDICADVAQGLEYIHAKGYIYGDLTASNVLLKGGQAKISGFMTLIDKSVDVHRSLPPGSPPCMPMRSFSSSYDESIDCFSLGILAMHIAIRKAPSSPYTIAEFGSITEMKRFESCLDQIDSYHPLQPIIRNCLKGEADRPSSAALATELSAMKETAEYKASHQPSEGDIEQMKAQIGENESERTKLLIELEERVGEIERMNAQIREMEREKNRLTIEFQAKKMQMDKRVKRQSATVRALRKDVSEKEADLQDLRQEKDEMVSKHQQQEASLREEMNDITKTAEICFLAIHFAYQKTHQDCETAKHRAQTLSNKEEETKQKMEILEKTCTDEKQTMNKQKAELQVLQRELHKVRDERDKARIEIEEKDAKIKELRKQRENTDESLAKLYHRAYSQGVELSTD
jgi:serine/threonine protein kinase